MQQKYYSTRPSSLPASLQYNNTTHQFNSMKTYFIFFCIFLIQHIFVFFIFFKCSVNILYFVFSFLVNAIKLCTNIYTRCNITQCHKCFHHAVPGQYQYHKCFHHAVPQMFPAIFLTISEFYNFHFWKET